jgi:DNA-binding transcriptional MocR family regulator
MSVQNVIRGDSSVKIASSIEEAVAAGKLSGGTQLPAVRALAIELSVSPATVGAAYRLLQDRGIVVSDGRRGTSIRHVTPVAVTPEVRIPPGVRDLAGGNPDQQLLPDLDKAAHKLRMRQRVYGEELNDPALLEIGRALFGADHVPNAHLAVVSGALDGIERVLREHLRAGDRVAVEDPCFTGVLDLLGALSLVPVPVRIDDEGMLAGELRRALKTADAVIVTPRAQNPTGAALTARRARDLQRVLADFPRALVIEDDHAGVIAGAGYHTLANASRERWAVVRSVAKSLGPDIRLALLACDERTHARVEGRQTLGIRWVSHLLQKLVVALLRDRATQRLLERASRTYSERRQALIRALAKHGIAAHGQSGLNVWIPVAEEGAIVQALLAAGFAVKGGERFRIVTGPAIRITVAALETADAPRVADALAAILRPRGRVSSASWS